MAISRYAFINNTEVNVSGFIYRAVEDDLLSYETHISVEGKRLDQYAYEFYGDSNDWWLIAAASGIGWWLQIPGGILLKIPNDTNQIQSFIDNLEN